MAQLHHQQLKTQCFDSKRDNKTIASGEKPLYSSTFEYQIVLMYHFRLSGIA